MIQPEFICHTCEDAVPHQTEGTWTCRCGAVTVEFSVNEAWGGGFLLKTEGEIRLKNKTEYEQEAWTRQAEDILRINYRSHGPFGWSAGVLIVIAVSGLSGEAGAAVARAVKHNPRVLETLFSRN